MNRALAPLLEVRGLTRRFGERNVFDKVSFALSRGEIVSLVGPSGCGKSTLLRAVAGLDHATMGTVLIDGVPLLAPSPRVRMIFQEPRLLPWLSVADNIGRIQPVDAIVWLNRSAGVS
ncbi:ABC-type nitrate/sulfonate/bicarbonate transport system ATPase subunit [Paraburkholderia sp. JPY465]